MKTVMPREPAANCGPMGALNMPCVVAINAIALAVKQYDRREIWPSELAYKILGTISVLTDREKSIVLDYFRKCGHMPPKE